MVKMGKQWTEADCTGSGATCFNIAKAKQVECSVCDQWFGSGTIYVGTYTGGTQPGPPNYFCADCFQKTRPWPAACHCEKSLKWAETHRKEKEARRWTPPGPPLNPPPYTPQPLPPGPPPLTALATHAWMPQSIGVMQPTPQPQRPSPHAATSSATSSSAGIADYSALVRIVENLQQEMTEMKDKIEELEETVEALQKESELWYEVQNNTS